ncbi:MAG: glycosyltransferase, partial [Polyangiaceae bacterium]|nr:glycosyltransferase [Polyangiaceae bacterium]
MKRIGLLTTSYPRFPGDVAGCFVEGFAETLVSIGHSVEVHCPEPPERSTRAPRPGIDVSEVPYMRPRRAARTFYGDGVPENVRRAPWLGLGVPAFAAALDRAVARAVPHLSALVSHWAIPSGLVAARHAGARPHVAVFHSADVHLLERLPMSRALARALLRGTTAAWFVSDDLHERFARCAGGLPRELRVHVAPMGFEPDITPPRSRSEVRARLGLERFTVLALSRLVPIKGLDDAVLALGRVRNVELVIAGEGSERAQLERLARSSSTCARFEGHVVGECKRALL